MSTVFHSPFMLLVGLPLAGCGGGGPYGTDSEAATDQGQAGDLETDDDLSGAGGGDSAPSGGAPTTGAGGGLGGTGSSAGPNAVGDGDGDETEAGGSGSDVPSPLGCTGHDYVFCEDFENQTINTDVWESHGGSIELSGEHVAFGNQSLKLVFTPGNEAPILQLKQFPEALRSHLFGRVYVWSEEPYPGVQYPGDNYVTQQHVEFFRARSAQPNDYMGFAAGVVGQMRLTSPDDHYVGLGAFVPQKSMCLEWEFDPAQAVARGNVTTDGTETGGESPPEGSGDWQLPGGATEFVLGQLGLVVITSTTPAMHVWLDEFVLDSERVGCPSAL